MWKLDPPSKELLSWYEETMLEGLKERIIKSNLLPAQIKNILIPVRTVLVSAEHDLSILKRLLTDPPFESIQLSNELTISMKKSIIGATTKKDKAKVKEKSSIFDELRENLKSVFDYDGQLSQSKSRSYKIAHEQGRNSCMYCNRLYSFTVVHNEKVPTKFLVRTNDDNRKVRPQLDHWLDKSDYPLLSLNLYNLIPSCPICNASVKHAARFSLATHIHPYLYDKAEPPFKFRLALNSEGNFIITIDDTQCTLAEKNMIRDLALQDIYGYHGELEGKDIYLWQLKNSPFYLENSMKRLQRIFRRTPEEVYRMFFGTEYTPENNLNRPFSKLKRDLLENLGIKTI